MRLMWSSAIVVLGTLSLVSKPVFAQSGLTENQRKELARQFQAAPRQGAGASLAALRTRLDAQEMRMTLPADARKFKSFLESSRSFKAIAAGQTPELGYLLAWNEVAVQASALDHFNMNPANPPPSFAEQFGPT